MFNETEIKMITISVAMYMTFFMYSVTGNPMLELLYTILTMINVATVTHLASKMDDEEKEIEVNYDIYDDAPINSSDDEEGEADDEVEAEAEEEQHDLSGAPTDLSGAPIDLSGSNVKEEALSATSALLAAIAELSGTVTMASNDLSGNIFSPESFRDAPLVPRQTPAEI
jgi:hypothetical protein